MSVTHVQLEDAIRVVGEGKEVHGLYAFEDAFDIVKSVARYYWRQSSLQIVCIGLSAPFVLPYFENAILAGAAVATVGTIIGALVIRIPALRPLLAPGELSVSDVANAQTAELRASR